MMSQNKLPVVCRYGGNFVEEPDHKVSYKDGTNRLIYVHPEIDYRTLLSKLLQVSKFTYIESIKYQYPTLGLDSLVSVENAEDMLYMKEAFFSQRSGRPIQLFVSGSQKTLPVHNAIPRNEGSPMLLSTPTNPFQFAMPQVIVSPLLDLIFRNLATVAMEDLQLVWGVGVDKELQNLKNTLSAIQAVLEDAEERQLESKAVQDWLHKLQDVAYEAEDLMDEIITMAQQSKTESITAAGKKRKRHYISSSLKHSQQAMACGINEINVRLAKIAIEGRDLHLETRDGSQQLEITRERRQLVSSLRDESPQVFGHEGHREQIIKSLLSDDSGTREFSVAAIVGMGGVGKTSLAKVVYNDKRVTENFQLREWFCVSGPFNVGSQQYRLWNKLIGKKFLLVLDNVWNEIDSDSWEQLQRSFTFGAKGSKILVTTRSQAVLDVMQATCTYKLMCLSKNDCWSLFVSEAFHDGYLNAYPDLLKFGVELIDKCKGLPLAAKALGGLLSCNREVREWEKILRSPMWDLQGPASEILPALRLSYQHLPACLKPCFIFCSIFPKDYKFQKERLVQLWVAHGFIRPEEGKQTEDTGSEYFNDLLSRSFFQPVVEEEEWLKDAMFDQFNDACYWDDLRPSVNMLFRKRTSYKMNALFHDLAKFISENECFQMEQDKSHGILRKIRHLSYDRKLINFESLYELKGLRTILSLKITNDLKNEKVPDEMFQRLRFIRVLDLSHASITELPNSIGNLRHLRYLNLSNTPIKELPGSICNIYNMQTLLLTGCYNLMELPNEMRKLTNLRHLDLEDCGNIVSMPPQIGRLTILQTLPLFVVGREKERGIAELKELTDISGKLVIKQLENVTDAEDARQANLWNKPLIDQLMLVWSKFRASNLQSRFWSEDCLLNEGLEKKVADGLKPHPNLKALELEGYTDAHFPSWMMEMDLLLPNLEALCLSNCRRCSILPPLGHLPSLSSLVIHEIDGVKQIGSGLCGVAGAFPSLENLVLLDMRNLLHWNETEESDFPCLRRLCIGSCPRLRQLPHSPLANLTCLSIRGCGMLVSLPRLPSLKELCLEDLDNLEEWGDVWDAHFPHLQKISIRNCPKMKRWPTILPLVTELDVVECRGFDALPILPSLCKLNCQLSVSERLLISVRYLTSLSSLEISFISNLTSMPRGMLQALTQLTYLEIAYCDKLVTLVEENGLQDEVLPPTLIHLKFIGCHSLESLPRGLHALTSLHTMEITSCPRVTSLPEEGLPAALRRLVISWCPVLKERCEKDTGEDWPKISHIPHVVMDSLQHFTVGFPIHV